MHPCGSKNPPSWCGRKKRRSGGKRRMNRASFAAMSAVANRPTEHGYRQVAKKDCVKSNGRLKKGCMWGRGRHKGKVFKRTGRA